MKFFAVSILFVCSLGFANHHQGQKQYRGKGAHVHGHGAHVHGYGTLAIAFEGNEGKIELKAPSESMVGFEHLPKAEADQKVVADVIRKFEMDIGKMVHLDASLSCTFTKEKIDIISEKDGKHSDFVANFQVTCQRPVTGQTVTVDFSAFSKLTKLDITILSGDLQKSAVAKKQPVKIELK